MAIAVPDALDGGSADGGVASAPAAARVRASISHPHLIRVRVRGTRSQPALVAELCSAPTLAQALTESPLAPRDAVAVVGTVASAVEALADHGLAPRELSPQSIHLHRTRGAILADTGVPPALVPRAAVVSPAARGYLSPEELGGARPAAGSLVYTLGAILRDSVRDDPPRPLQQVIARATAEDPRDRYDGPGAFASAAAAAIPGLRASGRAHSGAARAQSPAAPHPPAAHR